MTEAEIDAFAWAIFQEIRQRCERAGLAPADPVVGEILAAALGSHFASRGGGQRPFGEILQLVKVAMWEADKAREEAEK